MDTWRIVFTDKEKVEVQKETFDPALGETEILCAAICSLISTGTELQCLRGVFDPGTNWAEWVKYPFQPGYSMAAEVLEVGARVKGIRKGDRVFAAHPHTQFFKVDAKHAYVLPAEISAEQGTWLSLAKTTQLGVRRAELSLGESVGIIGLGQLGQLVARYVSLSGAKEIFAIDPSAGRLELVPEKPGMIRLAMDAVTAMDVIKERTGGKMLDVVFDITGHPAVLAQATQLVRPLGRVILLGDTSTPSKQVLGPNVVSGSVAIQGIHSLMSYKEWDHPAMSELFFTYVIQGRMDVGSLISHRHSPLDAAQVYEALMQNRSSAMGVMFDWKTLS
ncbi:2-desacetyl-2-hydroxyethyl bacteriochlorophyllide A dehydrogenase [Paenibacillus sp. UNCCL117]|uniref:zinc-binding dehydrogenase n=1 Tax=unclassified Paenibacillus TaxID=185978 RepID=UPI00088A2FE2|nr:MULTISPECIES: zinc-binding dehydrogenase [unclassified Paenibacillus]SDE11522.1 2-desacetyl-2-hydroxyethyl bacteriochlorophyllide A dehydrogenase [Paenibacillus sp. cl123]SFW60000.1 2-desacetyl-2-hydroxyethyl bacteriochlorophyllide A dehydrogenase [Paenibacillus sp. UNCCL117]